jgi:hypothetical protein
MALAHGPGYLMVLDVCLRDAAALARFLVNPLTTRAFICSGLVICGNGAFSGKGLIDLGAPSQFSLRRGSSIWAAQRPARDISPRAGELVIDVAWPITEASLGERRAAKRGKLGHVRLPCQPPWRSAVPSSFEFFSSPGWLFGGSDTKTLRNFSALMMLGVGGLRPLRTLFSVVRLIRFFLPHGD